MDMEHTLFPNFHWPYYTSQHPIYQPQIYNHRCILSLQEAFESLQRISNHFLEKLWCTHFLKVRKNFNILSFLSKVLFKSGLFFIVLQLYLYVSKELFLNLLRFVLRLWQTKQVSLVFPVYLVRFVASICICPISHILSLLLPNLSSSIVYAPRYNFLEVCYLSTTKQLMERHPEWKSSFLKKMITT